MKLSKTLAMMRRLWWLLLCGVLGFVGASLYPSLHGPSVEANSTLGATAAESGSGPPIIDGVDWVRDHSTTFSSTLTGHCALGFGNRGWVYDGVCAGRVGGVCHGRYDYSQCPVGYHPRRTGTVCGFPVDLARFCTP